jgi:transcriptional regulator with XRE-family HTH domain
MILRPERVRGLLRAKNLQQDELDGISRGELGKWLGGRDPGLDGLKRLAAALDATSDYLIGLGDDFGGNNDLAAAKLSFASFERDLTVTSEQKQRCRRVFETDGVLARGGAPRTADAWRVVAEMIDLGIGPTPAKIEEAMTAPSITTAHRPLNGLTTADSVPCPSPNRSSATGSAPAGGNAARGKPPRTPG